MAGANDIKYTFVSYYWRVRNWYFVPLKNTRLIYSTSYTESKNSYGVGYFTH